MNGRLEVTYYLHSGFSCALDDVLLVFDYWLGEHQELAEQRRITPQFLHRFREVYVFISHGHPDHWDPEVLRWAEQRPITYVTSSDAPPEVPGSRLAPGEELHFGETLNVKAFDSTDLGVSFLVELGGFRIFHAGDLNFWHWREESTVQEIDEAEAAFQEACKPLIGERIDLCFFPVDPRQGRLFDAGANYFIITVKPRLLLPMHFWGRSEVATEFARRTRTRQTEVIALVRPMEQMILEMEDDGFMRIQLPRYPETPPAQRPPAGEDGGVFSGTDLPVDLDGN